MGDYCDNAKLALSLAGWSRKRPDEVTNGDNSHRYANNWFAALSNVVYVGGLTDDFGVRTLVYHDAIMSYFEKSGLHGRDTEEKDVDLGSRLLGMILKDYGLPSETA